MQNILKRSSETPLLAFVIGLVLAIMIAAMGFGTHLSTSSTLSMSDVVIEDVVAERSQPKSGPLEQQLGWTAWSG